MLTLLHRGGIGSSSTLDNDGGDSTSIVVGTEQVRSSRSRLKGVLSKTWSCRELPRAQEADRIRTEDSWPGEAADQVEVQVGGDQTIPIRDRERERPRREETTATGSATEEEEDSLRSERTCFAVVFFFWKISFSGRFLLKRQNLQILD
ncbi:Hypothetical protein NTJ_13941 [Nesidiocoris tenuis]|uniref:Uncharacterized protein n=1 Tax=Nesidiocoris tenuis TaxID=355587 RepID=A0ABN7B9Q8_9HEMI|nr:Hypothetical protein NTJ_13941 [Nesidiocoris tenuis]